MFTVILLRLDLVLACIVDMHYIRSLITKWSRKHVCYSKRAESQHDWRSYLKSESSYFTAVLLHRLCIYSLYYEARKKQYLFNVEFNNRVESYGLNANLFRRLSTQNSIYDIKNSSVKLHPLFARLYLFLSAEIRIHRYLLRHFPVNF